MPCRKLSRGSDRAAGTQATLGPINWQVPKLEARTGTCAVDGLGKQLDVLGPGQKQPPNDRSSASLVSIGRQRQANPAARRRSVSASGAFAQERSEVTDDAYVQAA